MEITILEALALQLKVKELMKDADLTITSKMEVLALAEDLNKVLLPFMTVRQETIEANMIENEEGKKVPDMEKINKELTEASKEKIKLEKDSFTMKTKETDAIVTPEMIGVFKEIFKDKFVLETY